MAGSITEARERLAADGGPVPWSATHPYRKWQGAHWRLVSLVELGTEPDTRTDAMIDLVLAWLLAPGHLRGVPVIDGRARRCASQEGNALLAASRLGRAVEARPLAENLIRWQWPDGGWNCDRRPAATHSSFNETVWPVLGLAAFAGVAGEPRAMEAARRAADFLLQHHLFRAERTGEVIHPEWLKIHWPPYWHYDALAGLRAVAAVGRLGRSEADQALTWLEGERTADGGWKPGGRRWWRRPGSSGSNVEVVDWSAIAPDIVTARAAAVLAAAGREVPARRANRVGQRGTT